MTFLIRSLLPLLLFSCFIAGCGEASNIRFARASGTVTYKGSPLAGANVTFMPDKGPLAMGQTDMNGEFKLNSGGVSGCALGPVKVAVSVSVPEDNSEVISFSGAKTPEELAQASKKAADMMMAMQSKEKKKKTGLIPDRYKDANKSNLSYTIDADSSKNKFTIELKD